MTNSTETLATEHKWLWLVPAAMSMVAVLPLPYGCYQLLRIVVFGAALAVAFLAHRPRGDSGLLAALLLLAALFNPLVPVHLPREIWLFANLAAAAVFVIGWLVARQSLPPRLARETRSSMRDQGEG